MEFLRFGSSIPGSYWGCCAVCIIQNFKVDPDDKSSIQLVSGDGSNPLFNGNNESLFAGPTWKDIFLQRLRIGTFHTGSMPNHIFLAVLTEGQVNGGGVGKKWLKILKEQGFEFIRTTDNSVYTGSGVIAEAGGKSGRSPHKNYLFGLFRNIGHGYVDDPYTPPEAWTSLPSVVPEAWGRMEGDKVEFNKQVQAAQLPLYNSLPTQDSFLTEKQLAEKGVPVWIAGVRGGAIQHRKPTSVAKPSATAVKAKASAAPFG